MQFSRWTMVLPGPAFCQPMSPCFWLELAPEEYRLEALALIPVVSEGQGAECNPLGWAAGVQSACIVRSTVQQEKERHRRRLASGFCGENNPTLWNTPYGGFRFSGRVSAGASKQSPKWPLLA
ncbi:predicted protein [Uncinocarpus reesii 1704]|uniref:Uncharacterized protein n=1 Tax=Uncinocarpus reesii (strain UAMH 1704) TaxID=336963 RepID=C4JPR7_UNCRE|nr:uncharacterized protein UREG_04560 [Uncinocarpus reesii 1704]EEP79714.1 predicted protein [Uncinocarpus reesii 1704]